LTDGHGKARCPQGQNERVYTTNSGFGGGWDEPNPTSAGGDWNNNNPAGTQSAGWDAHDAIGTDQTNATGFGSSADGYTAVNSNPEDDWNVDTSNAAPIEQQGW
jgi:hypothetical protein